MSELFKDIPEFVETHIGESVTARTETLRKVHLGDDLLTLATFRELGPPDLCHVIKSYGSKATHKDVRARCHLRRLILDWILPLLLWG